MALSPSFTLAGQTFKAPPSAPRFFVGQQPVDRATFDRELQAALALVGVEADEPPPDARPDDNAFPDGVWTVEDEETSA